MKNALKILFFATPILVAAALYAIFQFTDPLSVGPGGVLGVFALIYAGCLSLVFIILRFGIYWLNKLMAMHGSLPQSLKPVMDARKAYYIASVLAFAPVTLLAMHAYSQLQFNDVILVAVLMIIATFYIIRRG